MGAALVAALLHVRFLWFVCDDAFITFRYASNLANGLGPVYNAGERVEGYSNFLWMILSSLAIAGGGAPETWMPVVSVACALATIVVVAAAPRAVEGGALGRALPSLLLASSASFAAWATSGLETALFTFLVTSGYVAAARGAAPMAALVLALASLTRPDGLLFSASAAAFLAWRGAALGIRRRAFLASAILWAACVLPHVAWRLAYYGRWTPNSFAVKSPGLDALAGGAAYLADAAWRMQLVVLLVPVLGLLALRASAPAKWPVGEAAGARGGLLAAMVLPWIAYVATTGGDFMPLHRFVVPVLPLLALASGEALMILARGLALSASARAALAIALLATFGGLNLVESRREQEVGTRGDLESVGLTRHNAANWDRVGRRLRELTQPGDTLATTAAGLVPYRSGLYTIDLLGLVAPNLEEYRPRATDRPGHAIYLSSAAIEARRPHYLLGHPEVRPTTTGLGLTVDFEPGWRERVLGHYTRVGTELRGDPPAYVEFGVRNDIFERFDAAARGGAPR